METAHVEVRTQTDDEEENQTFSKRLKSIVLSNLLVFSLIFALVLGIILGVLMRMRPEPYSKREIISIRFPGELFLNMLKLIILPLIVASLISGMTSLNLRSSGKIGVRAVVYYIVTTLTAVILGIVIVLIIQPGKRGDKPSATSKFHDVVAGDTFLDLIRQLIPNNMVTATFQKSVTKLVPKKGSKAGDEKPEMEPKLSITSGINMLGIVVMAVSTGLSINLVGDKARPLKVFFEAVNEVVLLLIKLIIWYSPIGVLFLVMKEVVSLDHPAEMFRQLTYYFVTVMIGLTIHGFVTLPAIFFFVCRRNPYIYMHGMLQALVTAVATASSSATLPVTMRNLEENNGVDPRVIGFVAPVGATINMDGTALYEAVAVIFIGQVEGYQLDFGSIVVIWLTSTAAAIGAAGVPQAGLTTMVIVLSAVGFPADRVGLILAIDWLLDRFRTAINVLGDAYGAGIVNKLSLADLEKMDQENFDVIQAAEEPVAPPVVEKPAEQEEVARSVGSGEAYGTDTEPETDTTTETSKEEPEVVVTRVQSKTV